MSSNLSEKRLILIAKNLSVSSDRSVCEVLASLSPDQAEKLSELIEFYKKRRKDKFDRKKKSKK